MLYFYYFISVILRIMCQFYNDFIGQILESFPSSFSPRRLISRTCPFSNKLCQRWVNHKNIANIIKIFLNQIVHWKGVKMWLKLKLQDPSSFMYCIIVNIRLHSLTEETKWCILLISIAVALCQATTITNAVRPKTKSCFEDLRTKSIIMVTKRAEKNED